MKRSQMIEWAVLIGLVLLCVAIDFWPKEWSCGW